jgi:hypothetical protein
MDTEHAREYEEHGIQAFRIVRGAEVLGPDGSLGTVEQIVVDGDTGELQSLVVRGEAGMFMELPASRIDSATGEQVYLSIGRADLAAHPELARPFKPELYIPVDEGAVVPPGEVVKRDPDAPLLTEMEENAIEIATPASLEAEADMLDADADEDIDIDEQPTVVLGPDDRTAQPGAAEPSPVGDSGDLVAPGDVRPANATSSADAVPAAEIEQIGKIEVSAIPEPVVPEPVVPEPVGAGIAPRVPEGAADVGQPQRNIGMYVTAGILAGTAVASIAYLYWSQRQRMRARTRRLTVLGEARAQLKEMRAATAAAQQTLSARARARAAQLAPRARALRGRGTRAATRAQSRMTELWRLLTESAGTLGTTLASLGSVGALARRRAGAAGRTLPSAAELRATLATRLPTMDVGALRTRLRDISGNVQDRLDGLAETARGVRPDLRGWLRRGTAGRGVRLALPALRWRPARRTATNVGQQPATHAAPHKPKEVRQATRRGMRRIVRQVRWFRRGMIAGAVWGVLYAPVPGREARTTAARYLTRVPYLRDYIGTSAQVSGGSIGSTGPHPRSDLASSHAPYPGTLGETPLIEPASEEPVLPDAETDIGSLPGGQPVL